MTATTEHLDNPTLIAARQRMSAAAEEVLQRAEDHNINEAAPKQGTWAKSCTYAAFVHALDQYCEVMLDYRALLAEKVARHGE